MPESVLVLAVDRAILREGGRCDKNDGHHCGQKCECVPQLQHLLSPKLVVRTSTMLNATKSQCTADVACRARSRRSITSLRSEEHTSELQSRGPLVCRFLLEK